jgi:hypothetical protein
MNTNTSLRDLERNMYRDSIQDGILDIQIGCMLLMFVLPIYLSPKLGDFWSSVVFLPLWFLVIFGLRAYRKKVVQPRVGRIQYGTFRKKRLRRLNRIILVFNLIALILGLLSFIQFTELSGWIISARFSIILLIGFSLAGYMLEIPRIYLYGILISAAPMVGEYLYQNLGFSHHGFPITFGFLSAVLVLTGLVILVSLLKKYPAQNQEHLV